MGKAATLLLLISVLQVGCNYRGRSRARLQSQTPHPIIGGSGTTIDLYPYQVSLQKNSHHFCGGAFIGNVWVLTAAHCCAGMSASQLTVKMGSTSKSTGGEVHRVKRIIKHQNYNAATTDFDVCLIETSIAITPSAKVQAIPLSAVTPSIYNKEVTVTGWGALKEGNIAAQAPDTLQVVHVPLLPNAVCRKKFRDAGGDAAKLADNISDRQLCAGAQAGGKDSCQGDSGGPMTYQNRLVGIVSWGQGCGRSQYPGLYANVNYFRSWILGHTGALGY